MNDSVLRQNIEATFPQLSFWYGMGWEELARMPRWLRAIYLEALPQLLATQELMLARAASFPYLKDSKRRSEARRLRDEALRIARRQPVRPTSHDEHVATLREFGIAVIEERDAESDR